MLATCGNASGRRQHGNGRVHAFSKGSLVHGEVCTCLNLFKSVPDI